MWELDTEFSEIVQRVSDVKSFRFAASSKDAEFTPGQFFEVTIKIKEQNSSHYFSFSCAPTDGYVEFTKRITGSEYSQALNLIKAGDWAHLKGPFGKFILPEKPQPLAFITGGIGITPLRSMIRFVTAKELPFNIVLLYSCSSYDEIAFRDELESITGKNPGIRVVYILSGPDLPPGWKGITGRIDQATVKETVPDYAQRLFYISGPTKMVTALSDQIKALGVAEDRIKHDSFSGYD
jgi:glycine betaine catabolism B